MSEGKEATTKSREGYVPDLTAWDADFGRRVQPIFSALFHDVMTPLAVLDSNLFLAKKYLERLVDEGNIDEETRARLDSVLEFVEIARGAGKRVLEGLRVPRDAVWKTVLEGVPFDVQTVITRISEVTKSEPKK